MISRHSLLIGAFLGITAVLSGCASTPASPSVAGVAATVPQLQTFHRLSGQAGLSETLNANGPYTLFAPSNEAFKEVPASTMAALAADKALLLSVLRHHVVAAKRQGADVSNEPLKTLDGGSLVWSKAGDMITVENAVVSTPDLNASNGVVHVIDRVLMPPKR